MAQPANTGISILGIDHIEQDQLSQVIDQIDQYSQLLVKNFENTTKTIKQKLEDDGSVAILSLKKLMESKEAFDSIINKSLEETDTLYNELDSLIKTLDNLDDIQAQVNQLYDAIVTVEQFVQHPT